MTYCSSVTPERFAAALRQADGNLTQVARSLGCSWITIRRRINQDPMLSQLAAQLRRSRGASSGPAASPAHSPTWIVACLRCAWTRHTYSRVSANLWVEEHQIAFGLSHLVRVYAAPDPLNASSNDTRH